MTDELRAALDAALTDAVAQPPELPGVVAGLTDRDGEVYLGAAGLRRRDAPELMTPDTVLEMFSCTKAVTAVAALQLLEKGEIALDAPARDYAPQIAELRVLEGFDAAGEPRTRAPRRDITVRHLFTHTSGLGYEFINADLLRASKARPPMRGRQAVRAALLTFDPGERWQYGLSMDWLGLLVEEVGGQPLGERFATHIFEPLGMRDSGFVANQSMSERRASLHGRRDDSLALLKPTPPSPPEEHLGGGGLLSTVPDYLRFLRMILNDGAGPCGPILRPETVALAARNHLEPGLEALLPKSVIPTASNDFALFPGVKKSWGLSFMINDAPLPSGRPAGALAWAGLGNLYYWIDRENGIAGIWAAQLLPFVDIAAWPAAQAFETSAYRRFTPRLPEARPAAR